MYHVLFIVIAPHNQFRSLKKKKKKEHMFSFRSKHYMVSTCKRIEPVRH